MVCMPRMCAPTLQALWMRVTPKSLRQISIHLLFFLEYCRHYLFIRFLLFIFFQYKSHVYAVFLMTALFISQEHLVGLSNEGLEDTAKPLLLNDQTKINRLEKQAEEFLNAVLCRKGDCGVWCDFVIRQNLNRIS